MPSFSSFVPPPNSGRLITKPAPTISLSWNFFIKSSAAITVPPVANRSSIIRRLVIPLSASVWICISVATDMHIHTDALNGITNLLIIDDLLATGGTVIAALDLIKKFQDKEIVGAGFVINLPELGGGTKLEKLGIESKYLLEF